MIPTTYRPMVPRPRFERGWPVLQTGAMTIFAITAYILPDGFLWFMTPKILASFARHNPSGHVHIKITLFLQTTRFPPRFLHGHGPKPCPSACSQPAYLQLLPSGCTPMCKSTPNRDGSSTRFRTLSLTVNSRLLHQLSYTGMLGLTRQP